MAAASEMTQLRDEIETLQCERDSLLAQLELSGAGAVVRPTLVASTYRSTWLPAILVCGSAALLAAFKWTSNDFVFAATLAAVAVAMPIWWYLRRWRLQFGPNGIELDHLVGLSRETKRIPWSQIDKAKAFPARGALLLRVWQGDGDELYVLEHASQSAATEAGRELRRWLLSIGDTKIGLPNAKDQGPPEEGRLPQASTRRGSDTDG